MNPETKNAPKKKAALGRGLSALLGDDGPSLTGAVQPEEKIIRLPLERVDPNPFQPRREFEPQALAALTASIKEHGLLQPLVVRPAVGGYQLIAGERRLRASQLAGLSEVPVVVREADDRASLLLALLENLQREDLNAIEEARAFQRLVDDFFLSHEEIATGLGRDRSTVANTLRLNKLPKDFQDDVSARRISAGHARCLLTLPNEAKMRALRDRIVREGLSVRVAERLAKAMLAEAPAVKPVSQAQAYLESLAEGMQKSLGARVNIKRKGKKGSITIQFQSDEDLERLLERLT